MPAWALLILAPHWRGTKAIVHSMLYPLLLGGVYIAGLIGTMFMGMGAEGANFTTIAGVRQIFASDMGVVVGWAHYLVFDLFVGAWIVRDSTRRGINHLAIVPCLLFTFMLGPIGLLMYVALRKFTGKGGWALDD